MSYEQAFQDGLVAAKAGKKMVARIQFEQVTEIAPDYFHGWLWLAWTADSPEQAEGYLDKAQKLQPDNRLIGAYRDVVTALGLYNVDEDVSALVGDSGFDVENQPELAVCDSNAAGATDVSAFETPAEQLAEDGPLEETHQALELDADESDAVEPMEPIAQETVAQDADGDETKDFEELQEELAAARAAEAEAATAASDEVQTEQKSEEPSVSQADTNVVESQAEVDEEETLIADVQELNDDVKASIADEEVAASTSDDDIESNFAVSNELSEAEAQPQQVVPVADTSADPTPDVEPQAVEAKAEELVAEENTAPTVLVVDDSPTVRKLVTITLKSGGYQVKTAEDGVEAMKMLVGFTPNLILLDVNMPRMDGYKLCKLIKRHDKTKFIPVVMLSGKDGMFDKLRGTLVGCNDYISKPFESADLLKQVDHYVTVGVGG